MNVIRPHILLLHLVYCTAVFGKTHLSSERRSHQALDLTRDQTRAIASKTNTNHFNRVLDKILVPRIVGTPTHTEVANFIVSELEDLGWHVERNKFNDTVPIFGELQFENIIGKLNPNADRFLVFACHYDSKYMREHNFVGATDSAVPCAMMLNLAQALKSELSSIKDRKDVSLAFIFFDGEEAFKTWGPKDSIYGARHLANRWYRGQYTTSRNARANHLERMDALILLDLLGAKNPKIYNYFTETSKWFNLLVDIEEKLDNMNMLKKSASFEYEDTRYFISRYVGSHIEDDHLPFYKRGVPILHIIPLPFPDVWHKPSDDINALDGDTIENLNKIFRVFVAQYLHLNL